MKFIDYYDILNSERKLILVIKLILYKTVIL